MKNKFISLFLSFLLWNFAYSNRSDRFIQFKNCTQYVGRRIPKCLCQMFTGCRLQVTVFWLKLLISQTVLFTDVLKRTRISISQILFILIPAQEKILIDGNKGLFCFKVIRMVNVLKQIMRHFF